MVDPDIHLRGGGGGTFEGFTMNVEFCEDNPSSSKKMRYFQKVTGKKGGPLGPSGTGAVHIADPC